MLRDKDGKSLTQRRGEASRKDAKAQRDAKKGKMKRLRRGDRVSPKDAEGLTQRRQDAKGRRDQDVKEQRRKETCKLRC
jgi:hypothetical protein